MNAKIAAEQQHITQLFDRDTPRGVWATLARAADTPATGTAGIWRGIARRLPGTPTAGGGIWSALVERADPAQYRPHAVPDVAEEQISDGGQRFTVIRSPRGTYLRLTEPQRQLWHTMDGTRTVAQLATEAFITFKQLLPVGDLVAALRNEGFLLDNPLHVYAGIGAALEARTAEGWGRRIVRTLAGATWQFGSIDRFYGALYRVFGWLLCTPLFFALWVLVALAGLGAFVALLLGLVPAPPVINSATVPFELLALWSALLISFFLHESAHALAVKHFGRTLRAGGVMLYFGTPAFFVDTSDIWRSPRRARVLVSAAGPISDLFVGALAALLVLLRPDLAFASVAYKLALTCYIATLFNLNPLLELDGYFILVDWLRLPDLRRRALAFVRGPLWHKLTLRPAPTADRRPPTSKQPTAPWWSVFSGQWSIAGQFSREERIFTAYGLLTLLYSLVAISFAVQFWNRKLVRTIVDLWNTAAPLQRGVAAALTLLVVIPVLAGIGFAGLGLGRSALAWVVRRGYGRQPALLGIAAALLAALVASLSWRFGPFWHTMLMPLLLWAVAIGALLALRPDYRRAAVAPMLNLLLLMSGVAFLAALLRALAFPLLPWALLEGLALMLLLISGLSALLDVNLRLARPRELLLTAVLLMFAFAVGAAALLVAPFGTPLAQLAAGAPAYFGALALALLLPHLFELHDSRLLPAWSLLWAAALVQTAAYAVDLAGRDSLLDVLAAGMWAAAWLVHLATLRQIAPDELEWPHQASISESQRLARAFRLCYAGCYHLLRAIYGARRTSALDDRMDVLAATANWDVTLDLDRARIAPSVLALPLDTQGARYAEVLRYTVATIEQIAGVTFARRAIQSAYDALPWPERETAGRYCFPDTPWARELSGVFGDLRAGRLRLLRQVEQFESCDDEGLAQLAHAIEEQSVAAGSDLLRAGSRAPGAWVLEAGEVAMTRNGQLVGELHRGQSFGALGQVSDAPAKLSYSATIATSLLFIPTATLAAVMQQAESTEVRDTAAILKLLERVPLFEDLPRNTLRGLALIAQVQEYPARTVIVRQGVRSGMLYIIRQGQAAVLARSAANDATPAQIRPIAQLGVEEFFGELELLRGTPPLATVVSVTPLVVLALPHAAVQAFIHGDERAARDLEQLGSSRLLALRG